MIVANMATFPARENTSLQQAVGSISRQVDVVNLCMNKFIEIPAWLSEFHNVNAFIPDSDYKDVGKFIVRPNDDDDVFLVDDDILYPKDYVSYLRSIASRYQSLSPIVGLHGVIYSDVFEGHPKSRHVFSFFAGLPESRVVNQLGTGTVHCKGWQLPDAEYMMGSARFVDVRFALHAFNNGWPLICAARESGWMRDLEAGDSIFESFTQKWPMNVTREVQSISGYGRLPLDAVAEIEQ